MEWIRQRKTQMTKKNFYIPSIAITLMLIIVIIVTVILTTKSEDKLGYPGPERIECPGLTDENCTKLMCKYDRVSVGPSCYMEKDKFGYTVARGGRTDNNNVTLVLQRLSSETPYGKSIEKVSFTLTYLTENIVRFQFKDAQNERYEVPVQANFPLLQNLSDVNVNSLSYEVAYANEREIFYLTIKRKDDNLVLWDTRIGALLLSDQYLQIGSYLPSEYVYGLGEHVHDTIKHSMNYVSWPMFARDRPPPPKSDGKNLYGVHPFYTCLEESGKSHGVLLLNSNAMEVTFMPAPAVSFRTIGGILDFFLFVGDNPEHVVQLYTSLVGRPMMPPYWSLGFQLSQYGYHKLSKLQSVVNSTLEANIPLACQYLDIDHMDGNRDFTYNTESFDGLPEFVEATKNNNDLKWIIILDPAIAAEDNYAPYTSGRDNSVYVKRSPKWKASMFPKNVQNLNITVGKVWPKSPAAFPDFFLQEAKEWWKDNIVKHHGTIKFDGLWIDMNEPANFETNQDYPDYCEGDGAAKDCWSLKCPTSLYEDPPYNPLLSTGTARMSEKTLCMESLQGSDSEKVYLHYDVHSLYGWSQTQPTLEAAQAATGTRSLVISRSTYPSSGRYGAHWLGDNTSTFDDLKRSIIGLLEFNLFGIPYVGADVCGFNGDTTPELCKRWMQLGAFYPFYRNHNGLNQRWQDPVALGPEVEDASRKAVHRRISLNPYLYTLLYRAHVDGNTVVRPVFHEFTQDKLTWTLDTQFLWGKSMMASPILKEGQKSVNIYLPKDEWWHFLQEKSRMVPFTQRFVLEPNADEYTPIHIRGGLILPYGIFKSGNNPKDVTSTEFMLYIFPKNDTASGELFVDDGISIDTVENESYTLYEFAYSKCSLKISAKEFPNSPSVVPTIQSVVVFKAQGIESVSGGFSFTTDTNLNVIVITVNSSMKNVTEITWGDSGNNCKMMP